MAIAEECYIHRESAYTCECNDLFVMMGLDKLTSEDVSKLTESEYQKHQHLKENHERLKAMVTHV